MLLCHACHEMRPEEMKFCLQCGAPLDALAGDPDKSAKAGLLVRRGDEQASAGHYASAIGLYEHAQWTLGASDPVITEKQRGAIQAKRWSQGRNVGVVLVFVVSVFTMALAL